MELKEWLFWYNKIADKLNLNREKDRAATILLSKLLKGKALKLDVLKEKLEGKAVAVYGAGPSLPEDLKALEESGFADTLVPMAADGAATALLELGIVPVIIVTDLDGKLEDILKCHRLGSIIVVHAHGDNMDVLKSYMPKLTCAVGTTQVEPTYRVYNFGGFTDGDRCVFLAERFGAEKIFLVGMDFGSKVGKYSKPYLSSEEEASPIKRMKLRIAKELIEWLQNWSRAEIFNLTLSGEEIRGVKRIHNVAEQLRSLMKS